MGAIDAEIGKLRFVAQDVETAYLNEQRAHERFTASSGAIASWVSSARREGGVRVGLWGAGVDAQRRSGDEVTYDITDPIAQAMLLRASVESRGLLRDLDEARELEYVLVSGDGCYRHSSLPEAKWHSAACEPTDELEEARARSEVLRKPFDEQAMIWLLMIQLADGGRAAALADRRWINDGVIPRFFHRRWTAFGVLEDRAGDTPLITPIHVFVDYPS